MTRVGRQCNATRRALRRRAPLRPRQRLPGQGGVANGIWPAMSDPETIVDWAVHWEKETPDRLHFIQPLGGGATHVATWTFAQAVREARRMASYLRSLNLPSKSRVAIVSKNCAHWILAD